ncbi:MAG: Gfo/Idh/MocA family oxidoreductase [Muribaculaceae bacterium]|nr:Gfo/Idh/MocA family oxidoreductase [Muribaculaceae bacterium]
MKIKVGLIRFGRMGRFYLIHFLQNDKYEVAYICDVDDSCLALAKALSPASKTTARVDDVFEDPEVQVVALCAYADSRPECIRKAVKTGKHIIAEKPIADCPENEWEMVKLAESCDRFATVNLYLRNSWYHNTIRNFIKSGEIGDLAILRVCHMTPGLVPGEGHEAEGPAFHDCGMHYVDLARWYADSEYATWHAQGVRMWSYKDPWWLQTHGTFENGVIFDITQGFVYGHMSKDQTHNSYIDIIGTKGIARMTHDFKTACVELRGVTQTLKIEKPFGGKNIDKLIDHMANSILTGRRSDAMPTFRDSAVASQTAYAMLEDANSHAMPAIGTLDELAEIRERRCHMTNGYGLLPRNHKKVEPCN